MNGRIGETITVLGKTLMIEAINPDGTVRLTTPGKNMNEKRNSLQGTGSEGSKDPSKNLVRKN